MAGPIFRSARSPFINKLTDFIISRAKCDNSPVRIQPDLECSFNSQINAELLAGYTYMAMANHFGRQCVALPGCQAFYLAQVKEEREHAEKLMNYLCRRGGQVSLTEVARPEPQSWDSPLSAFRQALQMELDITQKLFTLHEECQNFRDTLACNMLETFFLEEQVESVDMIARYIVQMERAGCEGLAVHLFDQYLLQKFRPKD